MFNPYNIKSRKINEHDLSHFINQYDRIFLHKSVFGDDSKAKQLVDILINRLNRKGSVILNSETANTLGDNRNRDILRRFLDAELIKFQTIGNEKKPACVPGSYKEIAKHLIVAKRKAEGRDYSILLIGTDTEECRRECCEFLKLQYENNEVDSLGTCVMKSDGIYELKYEIVFKDDDTKSELTQKSENGLTFEIFKNYGEKPGTPSQLDEDVKIDISYDDIPKENGSVYTGNGEEIKLVKNLGKGGEGSTYSTNIPGIICKIFYNSNLKDSKKGNLNLSRNKQKKIEFMSSHQLNRDNIVWPIDSIYNTKSPQTRKFLGYTMKAVPEKQSVQNFTKSAMGGKISCDRLTLVNMIINILDTFVFLHKRNIIFGDIKPDNLLISNNDPSKVYFVDCDGYQIDKYPATMASKGFIPPEIFGIDFGSIYRTMANENFAIFSLLFSLLNNGKTPYLHAQKTNDSNSLDKDKHEEDWASEGDFPYLLSADETRQSCPNGFSANWSHLPGYVKEAFYNVGHKNGKNFKQEERLSSQAWLDIFKCYKKDLESGKIQWFDPNCNEFFHFKDMDYSIMASLKMSKIVSKQKTSISLGKLIADLSNSVGYNPGGKTLNDIECMLRRSPTWHDEVAFFELKKNLGYLYTVNLTFKGESHS